MAAVILPSHGVSSPTSAFATTYDTLHCRPSTSTNPAPTAASTGNPSGHLANIRMLQLPKRLDGDVLSEGKAAFEATMQAQRKFSMEELHAAPRSATAHTAGGRLKFAGKEGTPTSTSKSTFTPETIQGSCTAGGFLFGGSNATAFKSNFLSLPAEADERPDASCHHLAFLRKAHRTGGDGPASCSDLPPRKPAARRDTTVHVSGRAREPMQLDAVHPSEMAAMKTKNPVLYHTYTHPRHYVTQNSLYGEEAHEALRSARQVVSSSDFGASLSQSPTRRALLNAVSLTSTKGGPGGFNPPAQTGTARMQGDLHLLEADSRHNPIHLAPSLVDRRTVSRRLEAEGHVRGSIMKTSYVDQRWLPEPPCAAGAIGHIPSSERPVVSKHVVSTAAKDALSATMASDGGLVAHCPPGVHPSIFKRLKQREAALSVGPDPHAHKRRPPQVAA